MKKSEQDFLHQLEKLGKEQARIDSSSPLPLWLRPFAAVMGEKPWQILLISSFVVSVVICVWFYPIILNLFNKGVLAWLLR
jgi:hypothetical protein